MAVLTQQFLLYLVFNLSRYDLGLNLKYKDKRYVLGYTRVKKDTKPPRSKRDDAKAWILGDTVLVVGSKRMSGISEDSDLGEEDNQRVVWEYVKCYVILLSY
jgi:hypothetical protein